MITKNVAIQKINSIVKESGIPDDPGDAILKMMDMEIPNLSMEILNDIIGKYREYLLMYDLKHFNTENRFIAKSDSKLNFRAYVWKGEYKRIMPMPKTPFTEALFGNISFHSINEQFKKIDKLVRDKREKGLKKLKTLERYAGPDKKK